MSGDTAISRTSIRHAYQQVADAIAQRITIGQYMIKLPSERALARRIRLLLHHHPLRHRDPPPTQPGHQYPQSRHLRSRRPNPNPSPSQADLTLPPSPRNRSRTPAAHHRSWPCWTCSPLAGRGLAVGETTDNLPLAPQVFRGFPHTPILTFRAHPRGPRPLRGAAPIVPLLRHARG